MLVCVGIMVVTWVTTRDNLEIPPLFLCWWSCRVACAKSTGFLPCPKVISLFFVEAKRRAAAGRICCCLFSSCEARALCRPSGQARSSAALSASAAAEDSMTAKIALSLSVGCIIVCLDKHFKLGYDRHFVWSNDANHYIRQFNFHNKNRFIIHYFIFFFKSRLIYVFYNSQFISL